MSQRHFCATEFFIIIYRDSKEPGDYRPLHDGFDLIVLLCLVRSPCGDSIDIGGDFRLVGFTLFILFQ
jgi:hypothetical protein